MKQRCVNSLAKPHCNNYKYKLLQKKSRFLFRALTIRECRDIILDSAQNLYETCTKYSGGLSAYITEIITALQLQKKQLSKKSRFLFSH